MINKCIHVPNETEPCYTSRLLTLFRSTCIMVEIRRKAVSNAYLT